MSLERKYAEMVKRTTIIRCLTGSQSYGLDLGNSDRDEKGICIEDYNVFASLTSHFEDYEYRSAVERTGDKSAKSSPGDLDLTIYSLRKYLKLALGGNPNITELLFIDGPCLLERTLVGSELQALHGAIVSKNCVPAYLGYMKKQSIDMEVKGRQHLIEKYGYDIKAASHLARLGFQGIELLETGKLAFPMKSPFRDICLAIKKGEWKLDDVQTLSKGNEFKIRELEQKDYIQDRPDIKLVEEWMQETYWREWTARRHQKELVQLNESETIH